MSNREKHTSPNKGSYPESLQHSPHEVCIIEWQCNEVGKKSFRQREVFKQQLDNRGSYGKEHHQLLGEE